MVLRHKVTIDNTLRIRIPKELLETAGLKPGDTLYIAVDEDCKELVITTGREKSLDFMVVGQY